VALFNHKGGVSKTTTAFHLGWMLAQKGHRVVLVDADPQCNLSGLILGYKGQKDFEAFYKTEPERNLRAGLAPAFESRPKMIEAVECVSVAGSDNLFLLPGHIGLSEYEVTLGIAQELSGSIQTLQNLPGSLSFLLEKTAARHQADVVLVDMNPSLSSINQNLLMTSDFFLVPTSPDYFSVMAIDSLTSVLPRWRVWAQQAAAMRVLQDATYPFPATTPRFLGTVVQKYRIRDRSTVQPGWVPSSGSLLIPEVDKHRGIVEAMPADAAGTGTLLADERYKAMGIGAHRCYGDFRLQQLDSEVPGCADARVRTHRRADRALCLPSGQEVPDMLNDIFSARRYRPGPISQSRGRSMDQALRQFQECRAFL
jgi:cellulose biosynthesis protein BcsQ